MATIQHNSKNCSFNQTLEFIQHALLIAIIAMVLKIAMAVVSDSMTMYTSALKNGIEIATLLVAWLAIRKVIKGADEDYNYGYGKLENVSSIIISIAMMIVFVVIVYHAIERIDHPVQQDLLISIINVVIMLAITAEGIWSWNHTAHLVKHNNSPTISSQFEFLKARTLFDASVTVLLIIDVVVEDSHYLNDYMDPVASILLAAYLVVLAYRILTSSMRDLLDRTVEESVQITILRELAAHFEHYSQFLNIKSRKSGAFVYIEIFLEFERDRQIGEIQKVADSLKTSLEHKIKNSTVVIVPVAAKPELTEEAPLATVAQ